MNIQLTQLNGYPARIIAFQHSQLVLGIEKARALLGLVCFEPPLQSLPSAYLSIG